MRIRWQLKRGVCTCTETRGFTLPRANERGASVRNERERQRCLGLRRIDHDLIGLTDEIYSELTYEGAEHVSIAALPGMRERCVFLHGFSKAFAMTGFHIGYACAPAPLTDAMMKIHQYAILRANTMAQDAAIEALEHGRHDVELMRSEYEQRRNYIVRSLNELGLACFQPVGAFYVFPNITSSRA